MKKNLSQSILGNHSKNAGQKYNSYTFPATAISYLTIYNANNYCFLVLAKNSLYFFQIYSVPRKPCSLSIASKSALKLPAPKPLAPIR